MPQSSTSVATSGPAWALRMRVLTDHMIYELGGGPKPWKFAWVVNTQKGGTVFVLAGLMWLYGNFSPEAWIYLALHGSYGLIWLMKDRAFPDPGWERHVTIPGAGMAFATVLGWYWVFGWLLIAGVADGNYPLPDAAWFAICIALHTLGCAIMIAADAQKFFSLRERRGLICDGMFARIRHPNYLGEMMIYGSYALMVWHWLPPIVLAWVWGGIFSVNMVLKEASMSRYPGWADYRSRSGWLLPKLR